jgi:hypothetical protein
MDELVGTPSDEVSTIVSTAPAATTIFASMSARHLQGRDADYLRWHTFDHRPEQYRLSGVRSSLRLVSTPACRHARAVSAARYDSVDHVMTYYFTDRAEMMAGVPLTEALMAVGRMPISLPSVEQGAYDVEERIAAPRIKVGGDVLPWWPVCGVYLLVEHGDVPAAGLTEAPGVGGVWRGTRDDAQSTEAELRLQITYCFLDEDPVVVAERLHDTLTRRWANGRTVPLLAAPFYPVQGYEYDRHLP